MIYTQCSLVDSVHALCTQGPPGEKGDNINIAGAKGLPVRNTYRCCVLYSVIFRQRDLIFLNLLHLG